MRAQRNFLNPGFRRVRHLIALSAGIEQRLVRGVLSTKAERIPGRERCPVCEAR
jgi:hypothetical protein